jgi:hypothetical protein
MLQVIGDVVGTFMEVDFESDDVAAGRFLRAKLHLDIRKPLQRAVSLLMSTLREAAGV